MKSLLQMLSEGDGQVSTMRVLAFLVVLSILIPAVVVAIRTNTGLSLSMEQITLILGTLGIKTFQRSVEEKSA